MFVVEKKFFYSLCLALSCAAAAPSALAQCSAEARSQRVVQTSNTVRVYGWEQALTQRDPSLSKWDWEPMTKTVYSNHNIPAWGVAHPKAGSHYVKPEHIDFHKPVSASGSSYSRSSPPSSHSIANHSQSDVAGSIMSKSHGQSQAACPANAQSVIASYSSYSHTPGVHNRSQIARAEVLGQLVNR